MNTRKATTCLLIVKLILFCLSAPAWAYQRFENLPQYRDYNIDAISLSRIYLHLGDRLWLKKQQLNDNAYHALKFIADSSGDGLKPNDYNYDFLQQLDPAASQIEAQLFDRLLSDGLLKLIRDISIGRLDPKIADPKWAIPRAQFDAAAFLQQALSTGHLKQALQTLLPASEQYRQLKAAAAEYKSYINRGGWPKISDSPVLQAGDRHTNIPAIRQRLAFEDSALDLTAAEQPRLFDESLKQTVQGFQRRHSLLADGIIGSATLRAMNVSAADRLQQIHINLERLRWLPDELGKRYLLVNLANYRLTAIEENKVKLDMPVIVGKTSRSTPSFISQMTNIALNPRWYVPNKLARLDLLPKQQNNPDYFSSYNIRVFSKENGDKTEIDPDAIDWHDVNGQYFPYSLIQDPGEKNALGRLKFVMPNPWRIYLHDTPSKSLFQQRQRNFSAGCIRVADPLALAVFSLAGNTNRQALVDIINSNKIYDTTLEQPLPVYVIYATAWHKDKQLMFSPDSYRRDQKMSKYL